MIIIWSILWYLTIEIHDIYIYFLESLGLSWIRINIFHRFQPICFRSPSLRPQWPSDPLRKQRRNPVSWHIQSPADTWSSVWVRTIWNWIIFGCWKLQEMTEFPEMKFGGKFVSMFWFIPTQVSGKTMFLHGRGRMTNDTNDYWSPPHPSQFRMLLCNWSSLPTRMLPVWSQMLGSTRPYLRHLEMWHGHETDWHAADIHNCTEIKPEILRLWVSQSGCSVSFFSAFTAIYTAPQHIEK